MKDEILNTHTAAKHQSKEKKRAREKGSYNHHSS